MHKISVINTSYNPEGKTMFLTNAFMKGFKSKYPAAETKVFHLAQWNFNVCQGCLDCWFKHPGQCVHDDDFSRYIKHINESYMVIFACPVWVGNANHLFRNFTERFICCIKPFFEKIGDMYGHKTLDDVKIKEAVMITTCALPGIHNFEPIIQHLKSFEYLTDIKFIGAVVKPQSLEVLYYTAKEKNDLAEKCFLLGEKFRLTNSLDHSLLNKILQSKYSTKKYLELITKRQNE
ncbi:MAG: flavodoxin family protein, partial [Bacteroidota bacterium]